MRFVKAFRSIALVAALVIGFGGVAVAGDETDEKTPPVDAPAPDDEGTEDSE